MCLSVSPRKPNFYQRIRNPDPWIAENRFGGVFCEEQLERGGIGIKAYQRRQIELEQISEKGMISFFLFSLNETHQKKKKNLTLTDSPTHSAQKSYLSLSPLQFKIEKWDSEKECCLWGTFFFHIYIIFFGRIAISFLFSWCNKKTTITYLGFCIICITTGNRVLLLFSWIF